MNYNTNEKNKNLNIITTDNRTFNNQVEGVISGPSSSYPKENMDNFSKNNLYNITKSPYKIPSSYENFKIGTFNVRSECNHKMNDILHKMIKHNIHILFVNELNINPLYGENCIKNYYIQDITYSPYNEHFKFYINADNTQKNSGCGFIFHSTLQCYLHKINSLTGRLLHLTFIFKKHSKYHSNNVLQLIGIYAPQNVQKMHNISNKIHSYISNFINNTPFDQNHVILGDFNVDYSKYDRKHINSRNPDKVPWHEKSLFHLYRHNYIDCALQQSNGDLKPTFYSSANINSHSSRIDYIFCNHYITNNLIHYSNIFTKDLSDHSLIYITLKNSFNYKDKEQAKQKERQNIDRINYPKVTTEHWNKFQDYLNDITIEDLPLPNASLMPVKYLDSLCNHIEKSIITAAASFPRIAHNKKHIEPTKYILNNLENAIHRIRIIGSTLRRISKEYTPLNAHKNDPPIIYKFSRSSIRIIHKASSFLNEKFYIDIHIYPSNIEMVTTNLNFFYNKLRKHLKKVKDQHVKDSIEKYINIRNENYKTNPSKMLDSLLNREHKRITLNKLVYNNDITEDIEIITDQEEIEKLTINHFQNIGNIGNNQHSFDSINTLSPFWKPIYLKDKPDDLKLQESLIDNVTMSQLKEVIRQLPLKKASGPSKISYEMIKHLPDKFLQLVLHEFNFILQHNIIPNNWRKATIFPIPKPKEFEGNLSNTRPITLLDCIRKTFVKIINNRLNHYIHINNLLEPNNRAGISGSSTMEIIARLELILTDQKENHKPLFIMLQDLSKAYDRVNINLLELALQRIHVPSTLASLIKDLFTERVNNIIMDGYLSKDYNILQGIDQGETICPLLWVIYYDPMFDAINHSNNQGYIVSHSIPSDILQKENMHNFSEEFKVSGYIDDTTWFSSNISDLESSLNIADEFYNFSNICINKDKTVLLTNVKDYQDKKITIKFGPDIINVTSIPKFSNERILGIYINTDNNRKFTIAKINKCLNYTIFLLKRKKISHDMCAYVINRVIIPRIEYWTQHIPIPESTCLRWDTKIRSLYKQFLSLPKSTVNEIFTSHLYINTPNIFDALIRNWTSQLIAKANTPLCKNIIQLLLINNQIKFHSPSVFPEFLQFYQGPTNNFSLIDFLCLNIHKYNLNIDFPNYKVIK